LKSYYYGVIQLLFGALVEENKIHEANIINIKITNACLRCLSVHEEDMAGNGIRIVNIDDASCAYSTEWAAWAALYPSSVVNGPLIVLTLRVQCLESKGF
jgi:hypothetical protein